MLINILASALTGWVAGWLLVGRWQFTTMGLLAWTSVSSQADDMQEARGRSATQRLQSRRVDDGWADHCCIASVLIVRHTVRSLADWPMAPCGSVVACMLLADCWLVACLLLRCECLALRSP